MKISIVIPVHNAEKYLSRCLESVLNSLGKIRGEILLVDDHSTDKSPEVMAKFQKKHPKLIRVLSCKSHGASVARNLGAKEARGEYLWFIDADDYITKSAIPKLIDKATETGADMVMLGAERASGGYLSAVDALDQNYKSRFVRYGMGPWQVLIRREWWQKHGFRFQEGIIHEDMELMSALILDTDKFASIDEPLYHYCDTPESVLHKSQFDPHIFDIFPALEGLYKKFEKRGADEEYHDELEWFFIWNLLIDSAKDFAKFPEGKVGFERSRKLLQQYFPKWQKNRFLKEKPLKLRVRVRLNYKKR